MENKVVELIKLIGQEVEIFEQFLVSLNSQQEALVYNDIEKLELITRQQEDYTEQTRIVELKRIGLVEDISREMDVNQEDLNLSKLTAVISGAESNQLKEMQSTLLDLHSQIQESKNRNEFLIKKSMQYLNQTISHLTGQEMSDATYHNSDGKKKKKNGAALVDRRA